MAERHSFPEITDTVKSRKRSGSFSGELAIQHDEHKRSYLSYDFSASQSKMEVSTISSKAKGSGTLMHDRLETMAGELGAKSMFSATSQPGFFKKMGYGYTAAQQELNQLMPARVAAAESGPQEEGGMGFAMEKMLKRKSSCNIM